VRRLRLGLAVVLASVALAYVTLVTVFHKALEGLH
jgi:hypothetical protein